MHTRFGSRAEYSPLKAFIATTTMPARIEISGYKIDSALHGFIESQVLPGLDVAPAALWAGVARIFSDFAPRNRALLQRRDELQGQVDGWHRDRAGQPHDAAAYKAFLQQIGYLLPEPADFSIAVTQVDAEISTLAGPQLVVPVTNARYALNAANARWGQSSSADTASGPRTDLRRRRRASPGSFAAAVLPPVRPTRRAGRRRPRPRSSRSAQ